MERLTTVDQVILEARRLAAGKVFVPTILSSPNNTNQNLSQGSEKSKK